MVLDKYNEWEIIETDFSIEENYKNETLFSLGNGYLGMRGNFEEGYTGPKGTGLEGTYINGFYETENIQYGEIAYGFPEKSQTMLNITNGKRIRLFVEDEEFNMLTGTLQSYRRSLNMKDGILTRSLVWSSPRGRTILLETERIVHAKNKHLAMIRYWITPLNMDLKLQIISSLEGNVTNLTVENDPRVGSGLKGSALVTENRLCQDSFGLIRQKTKNSHLTVVCSMEHDIQTETNYERTCFQKPDSVHTIYDIDGKNGETVTLTKFLVYTTSRDYEEPVLEWHNEQLLRQAVQVGYDALKKEHMDFFHDFWDHSDVIINGDPPLQQGIRFNLFHLLQSTGRDGKTSLAAKGLTGEGYEGHYFWDTEIFAMPFFTFTNPEICKALLLYRYNTLEPSRNEARTLSHPKGVKFPWRTIAGEECSAYFPAGTAQYHINADIAYMVNRYVQVTGDYDFLVKHGAEILIETARVWAHTGCFVEARGGKFCINGVTGPDEYTAIVNNNCYTNLMARENLYYAYHAVEWMKENAPHEYTRLAERLGLEAHEQEDWKRAADNMFIPYDEATGIYPQDDSFLYKAVWDFENTPKEKYPLLLHYHPLVIYRYQVCKQADLVLALFLLSEHFSLSEKKRNYDFYEPITTHDSSLSSCIFSIVASEIGYTQKAYEYFMSTARMDLDDHKGNTRNGVHTANMGGAWMCIVNGFAGMRISNGRLSFNPYLPQKWQGYAFNVTFNNRVIRVRVEEETTTYELIRGDEITILHCGQERLLKSSLVEQTRKIEE